MNELIFLAFCLIVLGGWAGLVAAAITLYDIRSINLGRALRRHPHARRWRGRPFISVSSSQALSTESQRRLRRGTYRNVSFAQDARSQLSLHMNNDALLHTTALRDAVIQLQYNQRLRFVEIIPRLQFPQTTRQFFAAYHALALAPFVKLRAVANIHPARQQWPTLAHQKLVAARRDRYYAFVEWLIAVTNLLLFGYVGYIAAVLGQADYLLTYMTIFGLWLAWSISGHPWLSVWQKIVYLLLAPASLGYFLWRVVAAPFAPLRLIRLPFVRRRVLS